jgi:2'-5' RNA ligase
MPGPRYLIAYTPPPESPLAKFGAGVLGYDCHDGVEVPYRAVGGLQPAILRLMTVELRRVGFHAGFMAPFCLGASTEDDLVVTLGQFARDNRVVPVGPLAVAADDVRVVLRPVAPSVQLEELADACDAAFAPLGAQTPSAETAASRFQFSMTLAEKVAGAELPLVADALVSSFAPMAGNHFELDAISLLREQAGQRFQVFERWRLTGR